VVSPRGIVDLNVLLEDDERVTTEQVRKMARQQLVHAVRNHRCLHIFVDLGFHIVVTASSAAMSATLSRRRSSEEKWFISTSRERGRRK
jgi:hypothetical protein